MLDLHYKKYDRQTLKENIYALNLIDIVKTQTLDITFIVRYILNKKYQLTKEEENTITLHFVLDHQQHITRTDLMQQLILYDSDDDSIEDFDTFCK